MTGVSAAGVAIVIGTALLAPVLAACGEDSGDTYDWQLPPGFPTPRVPAANPMTPQKVQLGRHLFYDPRLSGNGTQSCASCHKQELAFSDGRALGLGSTGAVHPRGSMALTNVAYTATLTWANPALALLEQQIPLPLFGETPVEMGALGHEAEILNRLRAEPRYQELFPAAHPGGPDPFTFENIVNDLASFCRTLISGQSPFDKLSFQGDNAALDASALRGMNLFFTERLECFHCHGDFNFSSAINHQNVNKPEVAFHNNGLYNVDGMGGYPEGNRGLYEFTGQPRDMGMFKAPSLRNIAVTAPYMHDGSLATLSDVLDLYGAGGRLLVDGPNAGDGRRNPNKSPFVPGFVLMPQEKQDVINFLDSLTDRDFLGDNRSSNPWAVP